MSGLSDRLPPGTFDALPAVYESTLDRELKFFIGERMGDSRRPTPRSVMVLPMPTTVWGFFFNSCIQESAPALVSLHVTKRGALRALIAHQWAEWELSVSAKDSHLHMDGYNTRTARIDYVRSVVWMQKRFLKSIEIQRS